MNETHHPVGYSSSLVQAPRLVSVVILISVTPTAHALTVLPSTTVTSTLSTDTSYLLPAGSTISTTFGNAVNIEGIAPVTFTNAGTIISSTDNQAAAIIFEVNGSLVNQATGKLHGNTYGVFMTGGGSNNNVTNRGDISVGVSHAIAYGGTTSGTVDNFGTLNSGASGTVGSSANGVYLDTSGTVTVNNHVGASMKSGQGDANYGVGIAVVTGTVAINNDGTIDGYHGGVVSTTTDTVNVTNSSTGIIQGNLNAGVQLNSSGTLANNGTISSTGAPAIELDGANNSVTLGTGSVLSGGSNVSILSGAAGNTVTLTGTGVENGNFTSTATANGLTSLTAASGSNWTLGGNIATYGSSSATESILGHLTLGGTVTNSGPGSGVTVASGGELTLGTGGASGMVTGNIVNNGSLEFNRSDSVAFANPITGTGTMLQDGTGTTILTGLGSTQGATAVNVGELVLSQSGVFNSGSYVTAGGATTSIAANSTLNVASAFTQSSGATLTVQIGSTQPVITAATASLNGTLNISGFGPTAPNTASALTSTLFNVIHTTGGITGDFSNVNFGGTSSPVDYLTLAGTKSGNNLDYNVGFGLTWLAGASKGNGTFTLANATDTFNVDIPLASQSGPFASGWDGRTLTKAGAGTLILSAANSYSGDTVVNGGTLQAGIANAFASSADITVNSGATLDLNNFAQQANNLSGAGNVTLGSATLTANNSTSSDFSGAISGGGELVKLGAGTLTLGGANSYSGGTVIGAGTLVAENGSALGTGVVNNSATLQLDFAGNSVLANTLAGTGTLLKTGNGIATLTAGASAQGNVSVTAGTLRLAQSGTFSVAGNYSTAAGATTSVLGSALLTVGNQFAMNGTLNGVAGNASPPITAGTATIGSGAAFNLAGYTAPPSASATELASSVFTEIHTTAPAGLSGTFSTVRIGGSSPTVDYLTLTSVYTAQDYKVGVGLTWYAAFSTTPQKANGLFTLAAAGDSFNMDVGLANQAANSATGWDGKTLTKAGAGTLQLSQANTYTGATLINGGTLQAGANNIIASSSQVAVAAGATFDLNGFNQQTNNLTGSGNVTLGSALLTENNTADTTFGGVISGSGSLSKTGTGTLVLSGNNTYTGPTTISAGTLQLGAGATTGMVTGNITDNGTLIFNHSDDITFGNLISGSGNLIQQGSGTLLLPNSQTYSGTTAVNAGALVLANGAQLATQQVTVAQGATLGGYGGVGGNVTNNGLLAVADAAPGFSGGPAGNFVVGGQLINNGEVRMASPNPASTLNVAGNYTGNNGLLTLSTALGGDQSATDRLVVHGNTAGQTSVAIQNAGGTGAQTNNGI